MTLIILSALVIASAGLAVYYYVSRRGAKRRILEAFERLAATMQIADADIQTIPSLALTGRYRTYNLIIESAVRRVDGGRLMRWRISTLLKRPAERRLYLQSETQEGRLRKVLDLEVINTGDELFDKRIMLFASEPDSAKRVFNPYMRERFIWAGFSDFVMEISGKDAILELNFEAMTNVRHVRHSLEVFAELLNILETV